LICDGKIFGKMSLKFGLKCCTKGKTMLLTAGKMPKVQRWRSGLPDVLQDYVGEGNGT
jgi:hypothetical protein